MDPTDNSATVRSSTRAADHAHDAAAPAAADTADDHPFGPHAPAILATEHWSLLATRSMIWSEALNRVTVFLTVLSASIVALALLANATGFGPHTTELALVLLPVVLLIGIATHLRLARINAEEYQLVLAMNRLRHAYLKIEPGLEPYFTTGHHDDENGVLATYMVDRSRRPEWLMSFLLATPTIVATVVAAMATAIVVLVLQVAGAPTVMMVACGATSFLAVWAGLFLLQQRVMGAVRGEPPKFPTPTDLP